MSTSSPQSSPSPEGRVPGTEPGAQPGAGQSARARRDPYAVIRPRRGRAVPVGMAILVFLTFTASAVIVPGQAEQKDDWAISDRLLMVLMGAAIAWFLLRFAQIRAVPSKEGLVVRNLLITRHLTWAEIVRLQFGGGSPWAYLDTGDFETVPLMAIQKADGEFGRSEASRLAALIDYHSAPDPQAGSRPPADARGPAVTTAPEATPPPGPGATSEDPLGPAGRPESEGTPRPTDATRPDADEDYR